MSVYLNGMQLVSGKVEFNACHVFGGIFMGCTPLSRMPAIPNTTLTRCISRTKYPRNVPFLVKEEIALIYDCCCSRAFSAGRQVEL